MKLQGLTVGPIVGETTPSRARLWGRSKPHIVEGMPLRCFGAVRVRAAGGAWGKPIYIKMNPNFDMTGVAIARRLTPDTAYEFQFGCFYSDGEMKDAPFSEADWSEAHPGRFRTASDDDTAARTLVIGSCRYLLKTHLGDFFDDRGDKTFCSVLEQIKAGAEVHQLIMMGDQIYADDLGTYAADFNIGAFFKRYQAVFSRPHLRELMARVPTYMTLDDHEIEDNWPAKATDKDWKVLYPNAIHAYQCYQLAHSPNLRVAGGRLVGTPNHLWYKYTDGCCDVFVTDSRTERRVHPDGSAEMLSREQMRALKRWLTDGSGRVKIVVTSVPFAPDSDSDESGDKWSGFHAQRVELLEHIEKHQVRRVVFFSGDVHASMSLELHSPSNLKIHSVVSSSFFWPYPHPAARYFRTRGTIDGGRAGTFTLANPSKVVCDDNFTRLKITPRQMTIEVFLRKGKRASRVLRRF